MCQTVTITSLWPKSANDPFVAISAIVSAGNGLRRRCLCAGLGLPKLPFSFYCFSVRIALCLSNINSLVLQLTPPPLPWPTSLKARLPASLCTPAITRMPSPRSLIPLFWEDRQCRAQFSQGTRLSLHFFLRHRTLLVEDGLFFATWMTYQFLALAYLLLDPVRTNRVKPFPAQGLSDLGLFPLSAHEDLVFILWRENRPFLFHRAIGLRGIMILANICGAVFCLGRLRLKPDTHTSLDCSSAW